MKVYCKEVDVLPQVLPRLPSGLWRACTCSCFLPGSSSKKSSICFILVALNHSLTCVELLHRSWILRIFSGFTKSKLCIFLFLNCVFPPPPPLFLKMSFCLSFPKANTLYSEQQKWPDVVCTKCQIKERDKLLAGWNCLLIFMSSQIPFVIPEQSQLKDMCRMYSV